MFKGLFGKKAVTIPSWSQKKGYKGGHRSGIPKRGSQFRKHTLKGRLFGRSAANRNHYF